MQSDFCTNFARGDFSALASSFELAGFNVQQPLAGVVQICEDGETASARMRLLISVGVHGDETAPIEMMALLLEELAKTPQQLAVDLMVMVGNIDAIAQAKRFIDVDLNRLFTPQRTQFNNAQEAQRADQLMHAATQFFDGHQNKWHLDLHTAIRASFYPTFAIVPGKHNPAFVSWLGSAGIAAAVLNPQASVTFSSYTCKHLGAVSCTAELGRIGEMGKNDLSQFVATQAALAALLRSGLSATENTDTAPLVFRVAQELIKRSEAFQLTFDGNTQNFTEFAPNALIATDGELTYVVGAEPEYVLFPNPSVRVGLRAGLMVVRAVE
ncbi:succinylglutamate desuccinylase [Solimicrobium silvestre]|uniref:Succinylglutamate desuccinylase n=1 Tax=Solimicrobium silvestre TaxID=2099400 RepID=A0A2S9H4A3_9BURK|nr:succinylglutamate desuccinylase [Solimicrobium silvestre]PRC94807.1 Succinylglutamate desuccinylase [Solimicrobium silvestre]